MTITLPRCTSLAVAERRMRMLLPVAEPAILAVANACGIGAPVRLLQIGVRLARSAAQG